MNHIAGPTDFARVFPVSRETMTRLEIYAALLQQWQKAINIVASASVGDAWHRHFADSAQLLDLAPSGPLNWIDLGSGGGFPGLVIGCMLAERPHSRLTLIESDAKKSAFLREVVRQTGLAQHVAVDIVTDRIENSANTTRVGNVDVISARALAPLDRLFTWCEPYFSAGTYALLPKGRDVQSEIDAARRGWRFDMDVTASLTSDAGGILKVRALSRI